MLSELRKCKFCGKPKRNISRRRLCKACQNALQRSAILQMKEKSGPVYEKWKAGIRHAFLREMQIEPLHEPE